MDLTPYMGPGALTAALLGSVFFLIKWILSDKALSRADVQTQIAKLQEGLSHCQEAHAMQTKDMMLLREEYGVLKGKMSVYESQTMGSLVNVKDIMYHLKPDKD